jgi:hypothetical protein
MTGKKNSPRRTLVHNSHGTYEERYAAGEAQRGKCPREVHAEWKRPGTGVATHTDLAPGLGFLSEGQKAFNTIVFAGGAVIAAQVANTITNQGATLYSQSITTKQAVGKLNLDIHLSAAKAGRDLNDCRHDLRIVAFHDRRQSTVATQQNVGN